MSSPPQNFPDRFIRGIWLKALADVRSPELDQAVKEAGIDLNAPLAPTYPRTVWLPALRATAKVLYVDATPEVAMRKLGQKLIDGLEAHGVFSGPGFSVVKLLGPRRMLKDVGPRLSGLGMGIEQVAIEKSNKDIEIQINEDEGAPFLAGALERLVRLLGGKSPTVEVGPSALGSMLRVRWS